MSNIVSGKKLGRTPKVQVEITQENIDYSVSRDSGHCMIAEAVKAAVPSAAYVSVDLQTIRWSNREKEERYTYLTPRSVQVVLVKFDQGKKPRPMGFELRSGQTTRTGTKVPYGKTSLRKPEGGHSGSVPVRAGGKPPPLGASSKRRAFGIRGLVY